MRIATLKLPDGNLGFEVRVDIIEAIADARRTEEDG